MDPYRILARMLSLRRETNAVLDSGACIIHRHTVCKPGYWLFLLTAAYISILNSAQSFADSTSTMKRIMPTHHGGHIQRQTEIPWRLTTAKEERYSMHQSITMNLEHGYTCPEWGIYNFLELRRAKFMQLCGLSSPAHKAGSQIGTYTSHTIWTD